MERSVSANEVLALAGDLTVQTAPARYRDWSSRLAGVSTLDLGGLRAIDSAGVAVVLALRRQAEQAHGRRPALAAVPARFHQLCVAHRVDCNGN